MSAQSPIQNQQFSQNQSGINFFIDCEDCDFTYIRQKLLFVSFVRDPLLADVHILVTDSNTGSGGVKYYLNFIGKKEFIGINYEYVATTKQAATDDDKRNTLLKPLKIGILQYYSQSGFIDRLNITVEDMENKKADEMLIDPWNKWIYRIESAGEFQKEESQNEYSLTTEVSIQKTTEAWKGAIVGGYEFNRENYFADSATIINRQDTKEISARYIKSLTNNWSARIYGEYSSRTYLNIKHKFVTSAAVEYNIFPWNESHKRILAIKYEIGIGSSSYIEETIFDKMKETLLFESLEIKLELIQPWGEISAKLDGSHIFKDFSKNQLTFESDISLRLTRNISVFYQMESAMIHNQLYLTKGDISLEDLLLKRRKLATTYEMSGQIGFRFIFGSIFNNVVNERF